MNIEIDFSKLKLGLNTRGTKKIEKCPHCGKKAEATHYRDGSKLFIHRGKIILVGVTATKHCFIGARPRR